jgi:hypothetical protein
MNKLKKKLEEKIDKELNEYAKWVSNLNHKVIIKELYKNGMMGELALICERIEDEEVIKKMLKKERILDELYFHWLNTDKSLVQEEYDSFVHTIENEIFS